MGHPIRASIVIGAILGLVGCGNWPLQYDFDFSKTKGYVSNETLKTIKNDGLTISQVKSLLGEPKAEIENGNPALGYLHCATWSGQCRGVIFLVPMPETFSCSYTDCQLVGIWFDENGHAAETKTEKSDDELKSCSVERWLSSNGNTRKSCVLGVRFDK